MGKLVTLPERKEGKSPRQLTTMAGELPYALTPAFSGRQALQGTQPDASAACLVMLSRSSALRNLIRMQSAVW